MQNVRVNKDRLEDMLSSQKSMQNYEDALWDFEKKLNAEILLNRLELVDEMQGIQKKDSAGQRAALSSLKILNDDISKRQSQVHVLRTRIEDIEQQNNRIVRTDKHRKEIVDTGTKLISFNQLKESDIDAIQDSDYSDDKDIQLVRKALDKIHQSLVAYSEQKKQGGHVVLKVGQKNMSSEPRFVIDSLAEME